MTTAQNFVADQIAAMDADDARRAGADLIRYTATPMLGGWSHLWQVTDTTDGTAVDGYTYENAEDAATEAAQLNSELSRYAVRYSEIGGWAEDLGTVVASSVGDALDIVEATMIATEHRTNTAGDVWEWNGTTYLASSEVHEADGFAYLDLHEETGEDFGDLGEASHSWTVTTA